MYRNLTHIDTKKMSHDEWLKIRRESIGGSDAAAIVGLSPFSSPYDVWAEKTGKLPPKEDTEAMRQGRDLEEYVAKRFCDETGLRVQRCNAILKNPDYNFAHANVDRIVVRKNAGLECKTTSPFNLKKFNDSEYPENYYVQCMHYMMITGAKMWYLAVLILGQDFKIYQIERNEDEIQALAQAESDFYNCMVTGFAPEAYREDIPALNAVFNRSLNGTSIDLTPCSANLNRFCEYKHRIDDLKKAMNDEEAAIKQYMGDAEKGTFPGGKVSWASYNRTSFDTKQFIADNPGMDLSKYMKATTTRPFKVTVD